MITIIRNDKQARFAHDVYGIKIKEDKPLYKIIGTLNNEGICIYESPNYNEVAVTFDTIIEAILNGEKSIMIHPPLAEEAMTKEEFDSNAIHDFATYGDDLSKPPEAVYGYDFYGRPIQGYERDRNKIPNDFKITTNVPHDNDYQSYYDWQHQPENKKTWNNKSFDNVYPEQTISRNLDRLYTRYKNEE
jgi:hypothetical protein